VLLSILSASIIIGLITAFTLVWCEPKRFIPGIFLCQVIIVYFHRIFQERVLSVMSLDTAIFILCIVGAV